MRVGWPRLR
uniref:Uncharacterized protein n=1 Tax=Arundo donax TaxID=35708 RepID=A0A0A9EIG1_ARUDO